LAVNGGEFVTKAHLKLADFAARLAADAARKRPPVARWNPDFEGEIDIRIRADGTWTYLGSPIRRPEMVKLFASILRRDDDGRTCLVTPVEKLAIQVDVAPFVAVEMFVEGEGRSREISFRTQVDDYVRLDSDHPLRVETRPPRDEPRPFVLVRDRLEALIARSVFYDLVDLAEERPGPADTELGVWSAGTYFPIGTV